MEHLDKINSIDMGAQPNAHISESNSIVGSPKVAANERIEVFLRSAKLWTGALRDVECVQI